MNSQQSDELTITIEAILPMLETIRQAIVSERSINANRITLDQAFAAVVDAIETLSVIFELDRKELVSDELENESTCMDSRTC